MYVRRRTIRQYAGFSTEESNAFIDVILLQDKRTIDRFDLLHTVGMIQITNTVGCVELLCWKIADPPAPACNSLASAVSSAV
jgi:hypothetical protein